jgi:hypothetical protein
MSYSGSLLGGQQPGAKGPALAGRTFSCSMQGVLGLPCITLVPAGRARLAHAAGWLILSALP